MGKHCLGHLLLIVRSEDWRSVLVLVCACLCLSVPAMFLQSRRSDTDRQVCKQRHKGTDTVSQKAHIYSSETHFLNHLASQRSRPWLQWSSRYFAGGQNSWLALSSSQIARASTVPICRGVEGKVFSKAKVFSLIGWGWCVQGLARCLRRMWTMQTQVNSKLLQTSL